MGKYDDVPIHKLKWVLDIEYQEDFPDSQLHLSCVSCLDILTALAVGYRHIHGKKARIVKVEIVKTDN